MVKVIERVDNVLVVASMGLGVVGIGFTSMSVGTPAAIAVEGIALGMGLLLIIGHQVNKKLTMKAEKHEKIKMLTDAKLNMISGHISKALNNGQISDEEYSLILSELEKFNQMKEEIRTKIKIGIDEETKQLLITKGHEDPREYFQNILVKHKRQ